MKRDSVCVCVLVIGLMREIIRDKGEGCEKKGERKIDRMEGEGKWGPEEIGE